MTNFGDDPAGRDEAEVQRLDKWLWFSRILKSRTLAAQLVTDGKVRINRARVTKPSHALRTGDVLTIALRGKVQILRVLATGRPPGPAAGSQAALRGRGGSPDQPGASAGSAAASQT